MPMKNGKTQLTVIGYWLTVIGFGLTVNNIHAQSAFDFISRNRNFSASNYCIYPDSVDHIMTPAPAGKKPFYISHYGRHGSRYLSNRKGYDIPYHILAKADSLDKLTPFGKSVLQEMRDIIDDSEDRWGDLTGLGKQQHRHIASRMVKHFPEVFADDAIIDAKSTTVNRCVLSMGAAVQQLVSLNPKLRVTMTASQADMWYMNHQDTLLRRTQNTPVTKHAYDAFCAPRERNDRLMHLLFNDSIYIKERVDDVWLNYYLLKTALIQQNTSMGKRSTLIEKFSFEEIHQFWQKENAWWYFTYGPSPLNGGTQPYTQRYLLRQIIHDADSCIALPTHGATLRYGHETVVLPLTCLLGINGYDYQIEHFDDLEHEGWWACLIFPMASNIQIVFYRDGPKDKNVLIKILLNENEARLPLPDDLAPYYRWSDFRDYYLKKLDAYDK